MAKIHARVTIEVDVPDSVIVSLVDSNISNTGIWLNDTNLSKEDVSYFLSCGRVCDWDDQGYIPDSWLVYDAVDSGLYEADEHGIRRVEK